MYDLTPNATALQWTGRLHVVHDNSQSLDEMRPTCNTLSDGGEIEYVLHVPTTVGVDGVGLLVMMAHADYAQRHILDTVVYVVKVPKGQTSTETCLQKNQFPVWEKACVAGRVVQVSPVETVQRRPRATNKGGVSHASVRRTVQTVCVATMGAVAAVVHVDRT